MSANRSAARPLIAVTAAMGCERMRGAKNGAAERSGVSPLLLGVAALLLLLIALVAIAMRAFTAPPLAGLDPPSSAVSAATMAPPAQAVATPEPASPGRQPPRTSGAAHVLDTATLELDGRRLRLKGVRGEGGAIADELQRLIADRPTLCAPSGDGLHVCAVAGRDLAELVLLSGAGRATADASRALRRAERQARSAQRGVWSSRDVRLAPASQKR